MRIKIIGLFIATCLITSCGFHLRSKADFPEKLRTLNFTTHNVYAEISEGVLNQLRDMHVNLKNPNAPFNLELTNSHTDTIVPVNFDSNAATSYYYSIEIHMRLTNNKNKVLIDTPITVGESVVHNVNQVDAPIITPLMRRTLSQKLVNEIYERLICTAL